MAHKLNASVAKHYDDGLQNRPYHGRMKQVSMPTSSDLRVWDGSMMLVDVPVNQLAYRAWELGHAGHTAIDYRHNSLSDSIAPGVDGCCGF